MQTPIEPCVNVPWALDQTGGIPSILELCDSKLISKMYN